MVHKDNGYYGHRRILSEYARPGRPAQIVLAAIQHGWSPIPETFTGVHWPHYEGISKLFWNADIVDRLRNSGMDNAVTSGAPWCYLLRMIEEGDIVPMSTTVTHPTETGVVAFPWHSSVSTKVSFFHDEYAEQLRDVEGGPVTVVLHPVDASEEVRRSYLRAGHTVTSSGVSKFDPGFLARQYLLMSRNARIVSNRLATALFYGAVMDREARIYGPVGEIVWAQGGQPVSSDDIGLQLFPELYSGASRSRWSEVARTELGADHLLSRERMRECLGLAPSRRVARFLYTTAISGRGLTIDAGRPVKRIGLRALRAVTSS